MLLSRNGHHVALVQRCAKLRDVKREPEGLLVVASLMVVDEGVRDLAAKREPRVELYTARPMVVADDANI